MAGKNMHDVWEIPILIFIFFIVGGIIGKYVTFWFLVGIGLLIFGIILYMENQEAKNGRN